MTGRIAYPPEVAELAATPLQPPTGYRKLYPSSNGCWYEINSLGEVQPVICQPRWAMLASDFTLNSTTLVSPPGWSIDVLAGENWTFTSQIMAATSATPDILYFVNCPAGTVGNFTLASVQQANLVTVGPNTISGNLALATGVELFIATGGFTAGANGTVVVQFRNRVGTTPQTFRAGSWFKAERIV